MVCFTHHAELVEAHPRFRVRTLRDNIPIIPPSLDTFGDKPQCSGIGESEPSRRRREKKRRKGLVALPSLRSGLSKDTETKLKCSVNPEGAKYSPSASSGFLAPKDPEQMRGKNKPRCLPSGYSDGLTKDSKRKTKLKTLNFSLMFFTLNFTLF